MIHEFTSFSVLLDFIDDSNESALHIHQNAREILNKYELCIEMMKKALENLSGFFPDFEKKIPEFSGF